ncbi:MAG: BON domain-containing protein [Chloroflexi bacterium]|nr:MAG: BON domain-containing protein [Chloroflexota bacterium]
MKVRDVMAKTISRGKDLKMTLPDLKLGIKNPAKEAEKRLPRRSPRGRLGAAIFGGLAGAAIFYLLDPDRGRARRAQLGDQISGAVRRGQGQLTKLSGRLASKSYGNSQCFTHIWSGPPVAEVALKQRVESEIFRDPQVPKGDINLDVRGGVVVLRGQVKQPEQIEVLERDVRRVPGVGRVENLLHVEGTPAPNKADSRQPGLS